VEAEENKYSVIIPMFNEEHYIGKNIKSLRKIMPGAEIIAVDGGSSDETINICAKENVKVIKSKRGRGVQLSEGAKAASGNLLCFLHADTYLPDNALELLNDFFRDDGNQICRFKLGFDFEYWLLNNYSKISEYDFVFTRFGDMCITVRKYFYFKAGGFPDWNFMEDVEFLRKASLESKVKVLQGSVISSARAYVKYGFIKKQIINGLMLTKYFLGFRKYIVQNEYYTQRVKNSRAAIIIFARYTIEGKVKTRLAATLGSHYAKEFYKIITHSTITEVKRIRKSYKYVFYSDNKGKRQIKKWLGRRFFYAPQEGGTLGEKMSNAFLKLFSHGARKAIIVGTDIPDLTNKIIEEAISRLDSYDIVIGPAKDGGYYLLGMKKLHSNLFEGIEFSTPSVLQQTINMIEKLNLRYFLLPELHDIDTEEELIRWLNNGQSTSLKKEIGLIYKQINGRVEQRCINCAN